MSLHTARKGADVAAPRTAANAQPLRLVSYDTRHLAATWGRIFVVIWRGEPTAEIARTLQARVHVFAHSLPTRRCSLLTIVQAGAALPAPDARTALANILRANADEIVCSAVALEGAGFRAAAVRAVANGLSLAARQPFPHRTFETVETAVEWLQTRLGRAGDALDLAPLRAAIDEVRRTESVG